MGVDWAENLPVGSQKGLFKFRRKRPQPPAFNFDFPMSAKLDLDHPEVAQELITWGKWFLETTGVDGFRIDAAQHMRHQFMRNWLRELRAHEFVDPFSGRKDRKNIFAVAEYFDGNLQNLLEFLRAMDHEVSVFDFPLHYNLLKASQARGYFDMRNILRGTLMASSPIHAVTFVDIHDTQPGQVAAPSVEQWFKPHAYALILLRAEGYPCIFWADYFGAQYRLSGKEITIPQMKPLLDSLLRARREFNFGETRDYFDDRDIVGWVRTGKPVSSKVMAVVLNDNRTLGGVKRMFVGRGQTARELEFVEITGAFHSVLRANTDGSADFPVAAGSISVWVQK